MFKKLLITAGALDLIAFITRMAARGWVSYATNGESANMNKEWRNENHALKCLRAAELASVLHDNGHHKTAAIYGQISDNAAEKIIATAQELNEQ